MDCRPISRTALKKGLLVLAGLGVFGCEQKPAAQAPPPPMVTVAKPIKKEIVEWLNFTAQTQAVDTVTVIPRVTGYIDNITFKEGDIVDFGDLLFVIDPRPYQAALDQAKGQLEQAISSAKAKRRESGTRQGFVSQESDRPAGLRHNCSSEICSRCHGHSQPSVSRIGAAEPKLHPDSVAHPRSHRSSVG